jgi:pSer/pThr/pTyr-binding forkhead associated (FHA) protein
VRPRPRRSGLGLKGAPPWGERFHRLGGLHRYGWRVAETPLSPHVATPGELRERLRAEAAAAPFLVLRDDDDRQVLVELEGGRARLTIGRDEANDVALAWDARVSRTHAALERLGADWTVVDDGLSRNGTWVNGERVTTRRRLRDGDILRVGATAVAFCAPGAGTRADATLTAEGVPVVEVMTPTQRRVLVALCRPYRDAAFATPASNPAIARELSVSVDAVKSTMRSLFDLFGIGDLPQNQKRAGLALQALRGGVLSRRDL